MYISVQIVIIFKCNHVWPESCSVSTVNLAKHYCSRDIKFFLGVYFFATPCKVEQEAYE